MAEATTTKTNTVAVAAVTTADVEAVLTRPPPPRVARIKINTPSLPAIRERIIRIFIELLRLRRLDQKQYPAYRDVETTKGSTNDESVCETDAMPYDGGE